MHALLLMVLPLVSQQSAAEPAKAEVVAPGVRESQVTAMFVHDHKRTMFRASVIGREGPKVTIFTAAHCLGPGEVGSRIRISQGDKAAIGRIDRVIRNPNYRPAPSGDIPGADNAVAVIHLDEIGDFPLEKLQIVEMIDWPIPDPEGGIVNVQTIDQFDKPHHVKAGNYTNPRWLEWGPSYRPIPGDSGSGMFVVRPNREGVLTIYLIGSVVDRSDRGGGGSLLHRKDRWYRTATQPPAELRSTH